MTCHRLRDRLLAREPTRETAADLAAHLKACPECTRFAARWEMTREVLGRSPADVPPPFAFAHRVIAHLPPATSSDLLGRFAFRALPAAILLALALAWAGLDPASLPATSLLADEPSAEELLTYSVLAPEGVPVQLPQPGAAVLPARNVEAPQ